MKRLLAVCFSLVLAPIAAPPELLAQPVARPRQVGMLSFAGPVDGAVGQALRQSLERIGWVIGRTLMLDQREADGSAPRLEELAGELVRRKVDAIYADGPEAAEAAARATNKIPIVFIGHSFPIEAGLVDSLARPGGNVTGVTQWTGPELGGKLLELLHEISPKTHRLMFVTGPYIAPAQPVALATRSLRHAMPAIEQAGAKFGIEVRMLRLDGQGRSDDAFGQMLAWHADSIVVGPDTTTREQCLQIAEFAGRHRVPSAFAFKDCIDQGGLLAYADDVPDAVRRSAAQLDRILRGARPADLPVEQPTRFELIVNQRTAKALGLTVPQSILLRADRVIE